MEDNCLTRFWKLSSFEKMEESEVLDELHKLSHIESEESLNRILCTLWSTRHTGLPLSDKSRFQSLLRLSSLSQLDPVSNSLTPPISPPIPSFPPSPHLSRRSWRASAPSSENARATTSTTTTSWSSFPPTFRSPSEPISSPRCGKTVIDGRRTPRRNSRERPTLLLLCSGRAISPLLLTRSIRPIPKRRRPASSVMPLLPVMTW